MKQEDGVEMSEEEAINALKNVDKFELTVDDKAVMADSLRQTEVLADGLRKMFGSLCVSARALFITGDTPVCIFLPTGRGRAIFGAGFAHPQSEVTVPLSPHVCLLISHRSSQRRIGASEKRVNDFNARAAHIAERFVISTVQSRRTEELVSYARRTLELPKIDRQEFGALAREGLRRFGLRKKPD